MFDIDRLCFVVCSTKKIKLGNRRLNKNNHKTPHFTAGAEFFSLDSFDKCAEFIGIHRENSHQRRWLSSCGQNYLHLLCQCCPKVETIRPLLELDPNAIKEPDANGNLPIHVAMTNGASHSVLSLLIEKYPHSVNMENKWGYTAFDWIVNRCLYELSCTFSTASTCFRRDIWRTLEVLIKAMSGNTPNCTDKSLLQMTFEFQCPVLLTRAILSEFPSMAAWKDDKGRVALATALNAPRSNMVPMETIQLLVVTNPKMLLVRDDNGRIPFHIAIDTNKDWNILKFMLQYEPECMQCRDGWTGLYPFMLLSTKVHVTLSELYEAVTFCVDTVQ